MPLSQKKQARLEAQRRQKEINVRSLDGKGYFMDAGVEAYVRIYMRNGDPEILKQIPDYREIRKTNQR